MSDTDTRDGRPNLRLLDLDASEAHEQYRQGELTDDEFERWASLNDLQADLESLKADVADAERQVIEGSIEADGDALVDEGEWYGVTIQYKLELAPWIEDTLRELRSKQGESLSGDELADMKQSVADLLAALWVGVETSAGMQDLTEFDDSYTRDWILDQWINDSEVGLRGAFICLVEQIQDATRRERELNAAAEKFRGSKGTADRGATSTDELLDNR